MPTSSTSTHVHLRLAARDASPDQNPTQSPVTPRHTYGEVRVASRPRYTWAQAGLERPSAGRRAAATNSRKLSIEAGDVGSGGSGRNPGSGLGPWPIFTSPRSAHLSPEPGSH